MVEHQLPKLRVAGSTPVSRSFWKSPPIFDGAAFLMGWPIHVAKKYNLDVEFMVIDGHPCLP